MMNDHVDNLTSILSLPLSGAMIALGHGLFTDLPPKDTKRRAQGAAALMLGVWLLQRALTSRTLKFHNIR